MSKEVAIYQLKREYGYGQYPTIVKKTFKLDKTDKLEIKNDGYTSITLVDSYQNGHNGDWCDDHESGYQTFEQARISLMKNAIETFEGLMTHIKSMKETK